MAARVVTVPEVLSDDADAEIERLVADRHLFGKGLEARNQIQLHAVVPTRLSWTAAP